MMVSPLLHRQMYVGDGLCFDSLRCVDDQQSSLAGRQRT